MRASFEISLPRHWHTHSGNIKNGHAERVHNKAWVQNTHGVQPCAATSFTSCLKFGRFLTKQKMRLRTFDGGGRLGVGSRCRCRENHSALQLQLQTPTHHPPISKINRRTTGDLRHAPLDAYSIAKSAPFGSGFCGEKRNLSGLIAGKALTPPLRARVSAARL